jgi:hypothetical protein
VAAYRADIEIGIRGQRELERLRSSITQTTQAFESLNRVAAQRGALRQTLTNYETQLNRAARAINNVTLGSQAETKAIREYVTAMGAANAARSRQNFLIAQEVANRRRVTATANAGFGVQGPALPSTRTAARSGGNNTGAAISSAIIGGGFPLLFGQGPGAAAGGALGGLAGGLLGGGFGFALSIAGTAIGDLITKSEALDKSLASLNSSLSSTGSTSVTTAADVSRLATNLRITNEEAVELLGTFSQFGDANIREAVASLFGGIGGASTFEAIARAGIDEKNALSSVFQLRQLIGNEAATQLALQLNTVGATQTQAALLKLVVERSIQSSVAASKQVQFTDNLLSIWENIVAGVATALSLATQFIKKMQEGQLIQLPFLDQVIKILGGVTKARTGKEIADERGAALEKTLRDQIKAVRDAVKQETGVLATQATLTDAFKPQKKDKAAEDAAREAKRVQEVIRNRLAESQVLRLNSEIQDRIAEAEAVGDKMLVARLQGSQRELDIQYRYAQELAKELDLEAQKAIIYEGQTALVANQRAVQRELNKLELDRLKTLEEVVVGIAEETALVMAASPELRQKLELEQKIAKWKKDGVIKSEEEADAIRAANTELEKQKKIREQINAQQQMLNDLYDDIANQIAGGVGSAIDAVASGVDNLGDSLKDIGRDILAAVGKMLIFYALAQALGALGGNDGVGFFSILAKGFGFKAAKDGGYWPGGFSAFADGGVVTKPTMGLVGEGGEPEYIIPASKMSAAMKRYGGGARGSAVIPTSGDTSDASGNATAVNGAIDVRYTVERINSVDYVTADQFQRGMQQAATQGAQRGEQQALRRLQNSASTRRRLGV